jgi:hypothetical protein
VVITDALSLPHFENLSLYLSEGIGGDRPVDPRALVLTGAGKRLKNAQQGRE